MKSRIIGFIGGIAGVTAILYLALEPSHGVVYQNPAATLGLGMIGLGLCLKARERLQTATQEVPQPVRRT